MCSGPGQTTGAFTFTPLFHMLRFARNHIHPKRRHLTMRRQPANGSGRSFKKRSGLTHKINLQQPRRGGIRL